MIDTNRQEKVTHSNRHKQMFRQAMNGLAAGMVCLSLAGCTSLFPAPPPETYEVIAPESVSGIGGGTSAQILVLEPSALKSLDSQHIVIKPEPAVVEYLANAQWTDTLPRVVQAKIVETFENTRRARAVARPGEGLVIDYQIVSDLRAFEARMGKGGGNAVISISAKLVSDRTGKVVANRIFTQSVTIGGSGNKEIVDALNIAFDKVASDMVRWVFKEI